ncbi:MAG: mannose-1-phosphate guanylyltransferase [Candidatus Doudnabacteria bacterium CG10_big_fil_rev_8_21_14_0_10_41_10]|uniref:Mannose-1-phosphate guanylyltransferase n=1 Tax=Candidatus Doudnabacteria bacterium CG10_big_fil_rev_8_21_14_0_10_41_10 TaxID=1974551 RepID=A0A2H0VC42_9BACT|nr:MAG: mannose-1-phosphate guanylyltransferase [Candidatus Doudnabacteria bacterium CG10_big_fil_rev_8_21_14_0_10_41_10]
MKIVILAGGIGQRLWPLSRSYSPKQIKPFFGKYTLLQKTVNRLRKKFKASDIFIVTGKEYLKSIKKQLPELSVKNILVEPARKNTAAAIGLAAYTFARKNPKEIIISIASDHFIDPEDAFLKGLKEMEAVIKKNPRAVCLMGVKPTYPETGLGYIEVGPKKTTKLFKIKRFVEKPGLKTAKRFVASNKYLWNPSYFAWRVDRVKELFKKFEPKTHALLEKTAKGDREAFKKISAPPIDYAIMEKLKEDFYALLADFSWADIGHWASVKELQAKTSDDNVQLGLQSNLGTKGSLIYNYTDNVLTTVGVKDLIIVQTEDGTLICHKNRAQDVKKLVEQMRKKKKLRKFL